MSPTTINQIRKVAPFSDDEIRAMPLQGADDDLLARILADQGPSPVSRKRRPGASYRTTFRGSKRLAGGLAIAACSAAFILMTLGDHDGGPSGSGHAWAAEDLALANAAPRFAIDEPGWKIVRADESSAGQGEFTFRNGNRQVGLFWRPIEQYAGYVSDRANNATELPPIKILGEPARLFRYWHGTAITEDSDAYTALWRSGRVTVELATLIHGPSRSIRDQQFESLVKRLRRASADDWLSAMPENVILPGETEATVADMLREVPLPSGFNAAALVAENQNSVRDRYQLGATVSGAVGCAWIEDWLAATKAGDEDRVTAAINAMRTTDSWPVVQRMNQEGDYGYFLARYAPAMANGGVIPESNGKLTVRETYRDGLGCTTR